jgi:hypothetical protein
MVLLLSRADNIESTVEAMGNGQQTSAVIRTQNTSRPSCPGDYEDTPNSKIVCVGHRREPRIAQAVKSYLEALDGAAACMSDCKLSGARNRL